jgi:hypothetical protein
MASLRQITITRYARAATSNADFQFFLASSTNANLHPTSATAFAAHAVLDLRLHRRIVLSQSHFAHLIKKGPAANLFGSPAPA